MRIPLSPTAAAAAAEVDTLHITMAFRHTETHDGPVLCLGRENERFTLQTLYMERSRQVDGQLHAYKHMEASNFQSMFQPRSKKKTLEDEAKPALGTRAYHAVALSS